MKEEKNTDTHKRQTLNSRNRNMCTALFAHTQTFKTLRLTENNGCN